MITATTGRLLAFDELSVSVASTLSDAGLPGWAVLTLAVTAMASRFMLGLVRSLVPHESNDRLHWWLALLAHRRSTPPSHRFTMPRDGNGTHDDDPPSPTS